MNRGSAIQEDLFGLSKPQALRRRVRELDRQIALALKNADYVRAKSLNEQQEHLIKELVTLGDEAFTVE